MSLPFPVQNFVVAAYQGSLVAQNVSLLTTVSSINSANQIVIPGHQSKVIPTRLDWLTTYTTQAVSVNFQSQNTSGSSLDKLLMIYVDNSQNTVNTYIYFTDSQQYILAPAYSVGYYPVFTTQTLCMIYNGTTGAKPITEKSASIIIFCNFATPGFLASSTFNITYQNSSGPVVPTLGDRYVTKFGQLQSGSPVTIALLPTVVQPVQYVLTGILISSYGVYCGVGSLINSASILLLDTATLAPLRILNMIIPPDMSMYAYRILIDETGLDIPCQGLELQILYQDNTGSTAGNIQASLTYAEVTL